ncbi:diogenase subunit beta [Shigella dysenteriae]|uniref:Diogenase subunit beta n=1 Tax=Shigella dysenteriae TaxID=622 RepID=A0A2X2KP62_SHIDY|nr:diogenase subunit beta [Shigella dysenteriae]
MSDYQMFEVQVSQVEPLTEQVKRFTLVATDGKPLSCVHRRKSHHSADERW